MSQGGLVVRIPGRVRDGVPTAVRLPGVGALALMLALASSCAIRREKMLVGEIAQAIQTNPARVDLGRLYPAAWERVCVIPPHTSAAVSRSLLGFDYDRAGRFAARTDASGLWFVRGRKVVSAVEFPRRQGDFAAAARAYCLPRDRAVFRAELSALGGARVLPLDTAGLTNRPPPPSPGSRTP